MRLKQKHPLIARLTALAFVLLVLGGCTGHYDADDFDLVQVKRAAEQLADVPAKSNRIEKQFWPPTIAELKPISVRRNDMGIYIELDSFFVEESGLFVPAAGIEVETGSQREPYYRLLGHGIYSYHVTG